MVSKPLAILVLAGLSSAYAFSQTGNALVDGTRTLTPTPAQTAEKPALTSEMRGDIFMARRMYREAIDAFREGSPKDPVVHNKVGIAYHQLLLLDLARKEYEQAVKLRPEYVEAINNIGTIYYAKKSYRRAATYFQRALKIAPEEVKSASIYVNLGSSLFSRKRYTEAMTDFQTAMRLDPEVFERHSSFGVMMEERNVEERAKFHVYLAKLNAKLGRNDLALQYLRKAFEEGFKERAKLAESPEFGKMREMTEFKDLMKLDPRVL